MIQIEMYIISMHLFFLVLLSKLLDVRSSKNPKRKGLILKKKLAPVMFFLLSIVFSSMTLASIDPIPGVDVVVEKIPPGHSIGQVITDSKGIIALKGNFEWGYYEVSNRQNTIRAGVLHRGGQIRWQLLKSGDSRKPWKVINSIK
jgi:hypothetical protein